MDLLNIYQQSTPKNSQISFEIPTNNDLAHIENLHKQQHQQQQAFSYDAIGINAHVKPPLSELILDTTTTTTTPKTIVLNLAPHIEDPPINNLERMIFGDADMYMIINILWIGVVSALIVLSIVFILLSVYFYRKFRVWKQSARNNYNATETSYNCPTLHSGNLANWSEGSIICNIPPPCYAIATGLPTYAEALHRQIYGSKFIYHTQQQQHPQQQQQQQQDIAVHNSNCKKKFDKNQTNTVECLKPVSIQCESSAELTEIVVPLLQDTITTATTFVTSIANTHEKDLQLNQVFSI